MSENSQRFNLNKIIDDANKSLSVALEPISKEIETNFEIANKLNKFIEDIPIHKNLNNKYNDLLNENVALKEKLNKFETIFISLSKQNKELDNSNKRLIEKITATNNGFWYENKYFDCCKNSIQLKIIDDKSNDKKDDIQDIYCSNGLSYNNVNVKQSKSDIEEIYDIEETIKEDEEEESEEEDDEEEDDEEEDDEEDDKEDDKEEDCQDVFEIIINKKRYYVTDEKNGIIYEIIENDEVGKKIGMLNDEVPFFISV